MPSTRIDYGDDLYESKRQPTGTIEMDAYGLVQAQATFATDVSSIPTTLSTYSTTQEYPDNLGFPLKSYRYRVATSKGGVAMVTVDYIGVNRDAGYTDPHIQGVVNTAAQPIETHPNFTKVTDDTIGQGFAIGGVPSAPLNKAIFVNSTDQDTGTVQYAFRGFGVSTTATTVNIKAGVRQFLRPMTTVRGTIYFNQSQSGKAEQLTAAIGRYLKTGDSQTLLQPWLVYGVTYGSRWLVTAANIEPIGTPELLTAPVVKVTYDLMYGGKLGWDKDIYGEAETIF